MALKIPDLLQYEIRHRLEQWRDVLQRRVLRDWIDQHAGGVIVATGLSVVVLGFVLIRILWPTTSAPFAHARLAWFYDANTGQLFTGSSKQAGPIRAPSGPLPDGGPAGFRAHAYSYILEPDESDLFVGFLERPDPSAGAASASHDMTDFRTWAQGRLIKRVKDDQWVAATSSEGQAILHELLKPNADGQTPLYQLPRAK
jgi:hypothetical protein